MPFSRRTSQAHVTNALARAAAIAREKTSFLDLTVSNPTTAGLAYDEAAIQAALSHPRGLAYAPEPLGLGSARAIVAREHGASLAIDPARVAITASTSEAYAALFKVLADPDDEILVPVPSYPLLQWLADFENVRLVPYPLVYAGRWHVDVDALRRAVTPKTRAIVVVSPNNPTGSYLGQGELDAMLDLGLPVVSDEVFARYPLKGIPAGRVETVLGASRGLVFSLSGLSKLAALPQMKLGWIIAGGDDTLAARALERLELVLDAYLSVATPVQHALGALLESGKRVRNAISHRTRHNLVVLIDALKAAPAASVLEVEGGWYAVVRVAETMTDEEWALRLVQEDAVHVHPGFFFDMTRGAHLVVSLLTPEQALAEGAARIARRLGEKT